MTGGQRLKDLLSNRDWRLNNLYYIRDSNGREVLFNMNDAQRHLYDNMHNFNIILKARQLGFSTFILIYMLDACLFKSNHACGVIAQGLQEAVELFDNKIKFAYEKLPEWLRAERKAVSNSARKLEFGNGSSIVVGTSLRSGTFQTLHVSEYGKISARYPDKAMEVKTGAFNAVAKDQQIFVESTAEGQSGLFYELVQEARKLEYSKVNLTPLDPKFHFFPWWKNDEYRLHPVDTANTVITTEMQNYFNTLYRQGIDLDDDQKAWYVKKRALQNDMMLREYPSTPEESFASSLAGSFYSEQMTYLRKNGRITNVPWEPRELVHTFWDLGNNDLMAVWFFQEVAREKRFIKYFQARRQDLSFYARFLREQPFNYGKHFLPHDGEHQRLSMDNKSIKDMLEHLGVRPIEIVSRSKNVRTDIETKCKPSLMEVWIDQTNCSDGIHALDNYRRRWNSKNATWDDEPHHDDASNGADAFRTFAAGYRPEAVQYGVRAKTINTKIRMANSSTSWMSD